MTAMGTLEPDPCTYATGQKCSIHAPTRSRQGLNLLIWPNSQGSTSWSVCLSNEQTVQQQALHERCTLLAQHGTQRQNALASRSHARDKQSAVAAPAHKSAPQQAINLSPNCTQQLDVTLASTSSKCAYQNDAAMRMSGHNPLPLSSTHVARHSSVALAGADLVQCESYSAWWGLIES
jgi:hypothetical protein